MQVLMKSCIFCGKDFLDPTFNRVKKYCSKVCGWKSKRPPRNFDTPVEKSCLQCDKVFRTKLRVQRYCSSRCSDRASDLRCGPQKTYQASIDLVYADKIAKGCSRCSEHRPSCLQYHHIDPATKLNGVAALAQKKHPPIVKAEMEKCIILCANCHFVEENGDGYRPGDGPYVQKEHHIDEVAI
jgi:hypothetical protein